MEPVWLEFETVLQIHRVQIDRHGGTSGARDLALLESALNRPRNHHSHTPDVTIPALAAILAFGISRNHPFVDGNKRVSLVASVTFLEINGYRIKADLDEVYRTFLAIAVGGLSEDELVEWFNRHTEPI